MKISKQALRGQVYEKLHEMIENRRFSPGERINVEKLTEELGVSRTPVWQAVGLLEKEGILVYNPYKGVFINKLTKKQAVELYSVRETLECMAAELAVQKITAQTLDRMKQNLESQKDVVCDSKNLIEYSKLDFLFHSEVYNASGNEYLIELLATVKNKMRPLVDHLDSILPELYNDHLEAYNALLERNTERAREAFRTHNERMKSLILLDKNNMGEFSPEKIPEGVAT